MVEIDGVTRACVAAVEQEFQMENLDRSEVGALLRFDCARCGVRESFEKIGSTNTDVDNKILSEVKAIVEKKCKILKSENEVDRIKLPQIKDFS